MPQPPKIKVISLWQPWATLIALGHKKIETRSWPTQYRGPVAIHAAKREMNTDAADVLINLEDFWDITVPDDFPFGAVVATANLVDCRRMDYRLMAEYQDLLEYDVGNWDVGRYAWFLEDIKPLPEPIPARGAQGLWEWEPPKGIEVPA